MQPNRLRITIPGYSSEATLNQYIDYKLLNELNWEIYVNSGPEEIDAWFIIEDVPNYDFSAVVAPENIFFGTAETALPQGYLAETLYLQEFMKQFQMIFTHHDLFWDNVSHELPFLGWMINSNHGMSIVSEHARNFEYLLNRQKEEKQENPLISIFCSNQQMTSGHRLRYRFTKEIVDYFGRDIVWFGNGVNSLPEKWDGLASFKYSIVLENHVAKSVITEKLYDAILARCLPIYWGAPNVKDYFNMSGIREINILDLEQTKKQIRKILESGLYESNEVRSAMEINRESVLKDLNSVSRILKIVHKHFVAGESKQKIDLMPRHAFLSKREILQDWIIRWGHKFNNALRG